MQCMFFDRNGITLKSHNQKITRKSLNTWILNKTLSNTPWVKEEISREI